MALTHLSKLTKPLRRKTAYEGQLNAMADVAAVEVPTYIKRAGEQVTTPKQRRESAPISTVEAAKRNPRLNR